MDLNPRSFVVFGDSIISYCTRCFSTVHSIPTASSSSLLVLVIVLQNMNIFFDTKRCKFKLPYVISRLIFCDILKAFSYSLSVNLIKLHCAGYFCRSPRSAYAWFWSWDREVGPEGSHKSKENWFSYWRLCKKGDLWSIFLCIVWYFRRKLKDFLH